MIKNQQLKTNNSQKGFTLVELMITIFVIAVGLIGIMTLIQDTLRSAAYIRLHLTSSYLAQEGIELTRNVRDNNWINQKDWDAGLKHCSTGCVIGYNDDSLSPYNGQFLLVDSDYFYNHDSGDQSNFKRIITVNDENDYLEIISRVSWGYRGEELFVEAVDHLYNWR